MQNTEEGISWQVWELVARLTRIWNLSWDVGNQAGEVGIGPDE